MVESINKWAVYVWNYGDNINLAIDEIDMAVNRAYQPPLAIRELAAYGRHNKVGLVVAARRPANIPRSITSQADFIFTFQQHEPGDIKYFKDCGAPVDILTALPKHHFLRRNPEGIWETFSSPWSGGITGTT